MCGVLGVFNSENAAYDVMLGLFAIQNRGQESCGLAASDEKEIRNFRSMGLVKDVLTPDVLDSMPGKQAIGHVRYPTRGSDNVSNSQPHLVESLEGTLFSLASNGDITNYDSIALKLMKEGVRFKSGNDGELLLRYIVWSHLRQNLTVVQSIQSLMKDVKGAFSTVLMSRDEMWAFRDPYAVRPYSFGKLENGGYAFASESKALDLLRCEEIEELEPGEIIHVWKGGMERIKNNELLTIRNGRKSCAHCVFEPVYFSMPDSREYGVNVYEARKEMGRKLASYDKDLDIDIVVPVPDSSNMQAMGYAQAKGVPFEMGLIRNHYVGRTFIKPSQAGRDESVKQKFNPVKSILEGKKIVLVDDSIVRGTTMRKIVGMLRSAGAKEIHLRIASPQVKYSCFYGLDTPTRIELVANKMSIEDLVTHLRVDSLKYIEQKDLSDAVNNDNDRFCFACFDGNYPIELIDVGK
ncbi:MAG: amidophosphoribosyltransferase [Candidatus Delongbacteria bacterium]|nr:amidophosphoribosyltransferase [Candidatus Delongbacteria bacterium]MBN2834276.1 amidophosphoribosyltransferase [Candidatus Delongbacteria bacterium]